MFRIKKTFKIKDGSSPLDNISPPDNIPAFLNLFYVKLLQDAYIHSSVPVENFLSTLHAIKIPFLESKKLIEQYTAQLDSISVLWQADFDSEESYQEYKNALFNEFNTDFHLNIDAPDISFETVNFNFDA